MSFKFSLIFVELYCLFVITKCVENSQFAISDVIPDTDSYFYTTRGLEEESLESTAEIPITEPVPVKPVYTLARDFVSDLEILMHKITQTFVRIGQKKEGQKTLLHIYNEAFTIASNEISVGTLKYIMQESFKVMQDPNASKVVLEFFEMVQELMQYDLVDWYFVVPFLYDINQHPVPEQILEKFKTEVEYILLSEDRKNSFAAAFNLLQNGLSSAASESLKTIPITTGTLETQTQMKQVEPQIPVKQVKSNQVSVEQVSQIPAKVTQIPVKQVEQVTQIPVNKIKSNQVEQVNQVPLKVTQIPVKQVEQVTEIPVKQVKSNQIAEETVAPVQVETVVQTPTTPESTASKVMRRVKSLPSYLKQTTVEQQGTT